MKVPLKRPRVQGQGSGGIVTFDQALKMSDGCGRRHLLLGNGFSMAWDFTKFSYNSLFDEAKEEMSPALRAVFASMGTRDFEEVIRALQTSADVVAAYLPKSPLVRKRLLRDADRLKEHLIQAVAGNHPERPSDVTKAQYAACHKFLANVLGKGADNKVYTVNYDLLLYWALMQDEAAAFSLGHDDGFRKDREDRDASYVEWQGTGTASRTQKVHYLHGALHLFDAGHQLQKYTWKNTSVALIDQTRAALAKNSFPLFVAEADTRSKEAKIQHSAYLHHNLKSFAQCCAKEAKGGSCVFVYGHSFADNDAHILKHLGYGRLSHAYVSMYGDPESSANVNLRLAVDKIAALRPQHGTPLAVTYFDAKSAHVWG